MKKKVLIISDVPTHSTNAGNRKRILNLTNMMKEFDCEVYFLYVINQNTTYNLIQLKQYWKQNLFLFSGEITAFSNFKMKIRKITYEIDKLSKLKLRYRIDEIYPIGLGEYAYNLYKQYNFDIIWVEYVTLSKVLTYFDNKVIKVIDTHDVFTNRDKVYKHIKNLESYFYFSTTKSEEAKGLKRADIIISIQDKEKRVIKDIINNKKKVVTIGEIMECYKPSISNNKNILFVGSGITLNIQALEYFLNKVYPIIKSAEPECKFIIAGNICNGIKDSKQYIKLGFVKDIDEVYNNSRLVINPVLAGTGLNIKTIEALYYSKPLVTTYEGARGLKNPKNICLVSNSSDEFANNVINVLRDDNLAYHLALNAYKFVEEYNKINKIRLKNIINL